MVLARRVQAESEGGFDLRGVLERLRQRYRECTVFALRSGEDACFLGATPEMLVSLQGPRRPRRLPRRLGRPRRDAS